VSVPSFKYLAEKILDPGKTNTDTNERGFKSILKLFWAQVGGGRFSVGLTFKVPLLRLETFATYFAEL
jgi:hypothetical protein